MTQTRPVAFTEQELYRALRIETDAEQAQALAREMARANRIALAVGEGKARGDSAGESDNLAYSDSHVVSHLSEHLLLLLACLGPEVELRVERYIAERNWAELDAERTRLWRAELEKLRPLVAERLRIIDSREE